MGEGETTMAMRTVFHVYAGRQDPYCDALNTRTAHKGAAKSLFTRYVNMGLAYVELRSRTWDDEQDGCKDGCCGATLLTLARRDLVTVNEPQLCEVCTQRVPLPDMRVLIDWRDSLVCVTCLGGSRKDFSDWEWSNKRGAYVHK